MNTFRALWRRLTESKKYREHFVAAQVKQTIPFQIRALMKEKGLSQRELAERSGLTQGAISRAASPKYGNLSLSTLVRIAAGFDVAFVGRFVPFSELGCWLDHLHEESIRVPTFEEETAVIEGPDRLVHDRPSASAAAFVGGQHRETIEELFRLTAPSLTPRLGRLIDFPNARQDRHVGSASDVAAVSQ